MTPTRRATMQWMLAAAALPLTRLSPDAAAAEGAATPLLVVADWPGPVPPLPPTSGYGRDPTLMEPKIVWPLTLTPGQRATVDMLADLILPADDRSPSAAKLGIGAFIDEWVSAPYPAQQADRTLILGGLTWLDRQGEAQHRKPFRALGPAAQGALLDALCVAAPGGAMALPVRFMDRLRGLLVLGFYTLPEGKADMGHIGDQPTEGAYPGPSEAALAHLSTLLADLKLSPPTA